MKLLLMLGASMEKKVCKESLWFLSHNLATLSVFLIMLPIPSRITWTVNSPFITRWSMERQEISKSLIIHNIKIIRTCTSVDQLHNKWLNQIYLITLKRPQLQLQKIKEVALEELLQGQALSLKLQRGSEKNLPNKWEQDLSKPSCLIIILSSFWNQ